MLVDTQEISNACLPGHLAVIHLIKNNLLSKVSLPSKPHQRTRPQLQKLWMWRSLSQTSTLQQGTNIYHSPSKTTQPLAGERVIQKMGSSVSGCPNGPFCTMLRRVVEKKGRCLCLFQQYTAVPVLLTTGVRACKSC